MTKKRSIGELIEEEINRQHISKVKFAEMIHCSRRNVYDIFKRNKIDIIQLKQISKALNRNFFKEIADDMDLVHEVYETEEEKVKRISISNFLEFVPDCLKKLGKTSIIMNSGKEFDTPVPDFGLADGIISFTYGCLQDRMREFYNENLFRIKPITHNKTTFEVITFGNGKNAINIEINNKTYEEWYETLKLAYEIYEEITNKK